MNISRIIRRWVDGRRIEDPEILENIIYNDQSGAQKNVAVGPALEYIGELTAATAIAPGDLLYIFKPSAGIGYVTLGQTNAIVAGAAPAIDTMPVIGGNFTLYSADNYKYIIGAAGIYLYKMKDETGKRYNP
jgi:hypothetical protein